MTVYTLDPLHDERWSDFIAWHPRASVVHTAGWLMALRNTYGYRPVAFTTSAPGTPLVNGVVLCRIVSWLTGKRLVSLPFADHCDLLIDRPEDHDEILAAIQGTAAKEHLKYVELRSRDAECRLNAAWETAASFRFHALDLRPPAEELFRASHKTAVQQAIRRAEREKLQYSEGTSDALLTEFYRLLLLTRRRHKLPPQPIQWFRCLIECLGDHLKIRVAVKDGQTVASILTLEWRGTIFYKYGCSDARFHNLGGIAFLLWKAIHAGKETGAHSLDFGRSDTDNTGLIAFKDRWGAQQSSLSYVRHSARPYRRVGDGHGARLLQQVFARLPDEMLAAAGRVLYRHIG